MYYSMSLHYNIAHAMIVGHMMWVTPPLMNNGRIEATEDTKLVEAAVKTLSCRGIFVIGTMIFRHTALGQELLLNGTRETWVNNPRVTLII